MLASMRSRFLLSFVVAFSVAAFLPVQAQMNGVPPSVTSIGFGGRFINGVPPSVTSIGFGNNWSVFGSCCANFFVPANPNPAPISGHHHDKDRGSFAVGVLEPAYIPYAIPYAPEPSYDSPDSDSPDTDSLDTDSLDNDSVVAASPRNADPSTKHSGNRDSAAKAGAIAEESVAAQPSTVLVFKDGRQSDVLNYAIVGDTLFDFEAGRTRKILLADLDLKATRKANDDRGVDFEVPPSTTGQ